MSVVYEWKWMNWVTANEESCATQCHCWLIQDLYFAAENPLIKSRRDRKCRQTASWWEIGSFANYSRITINNITRMVAFGTAWTGFTPEETVSNRSLPAAIRMDGGPINISDGRRKCLPSTCVRDGSAGGFTSCPPVKVPFVFFLSGKLSRFLTSEMNGHSFVPYVCFYSNRRTHAYDENGKETERNTTRRGKSIAPWGQTAVYSSPVDVC